MRNGIQLAEEGKYFWIEIGSKDSFTVITHEKDFLTYFYAMDKI